MRMKAQGRLIQVRLIEIHEIFAKNKVGYFSNRSRTIPYASRIAIEISSFGGVKKKHRKFPCVYPMDDV